jgi:hypothetical protein
MAKFFGNQKNWDVIITGLPVFILKISLKKIRTRLF